MKRELYQFYPEVYPFNLWIYVGKDVSGMGECFNNDFSYEKDVYVMGESFNNDFSYEKDVYVMGERGYLSRTSRPRNAFSPPHPLRWKTGNAFLPQT